MEFLAKIFGISFDYKTGKPVVQIVCESRKGFEQLSEMEGKPLRVNIDIFRKRRSLNANSYFHSLCSQIAKALTPPISESRCKNLLIGRYGQPEYMDEERTIPAGIKSNLPPDIMLEQETLHCRVVNGGDERTWFYRVMRPTHTYNTAEFAKLLDGTISEAQELGIDTVTDKEKQQMLERWANEKRTR